MSSDIPHCHNVNISGSINQPTVADHTIRIMEEPTTANKDFATISEAQQYSDKFPLTDLHLCRYEDCHGAKKGETESPLDPIKTRALYILIILVFFWAILYIILSYYGIV